MSILLYTLNSTLYFVYIRTEDDRRTVETSIVYPRSVHEVEGVFFKKCRFFS